MTLKLLIEISALFASLFIVGSLACLPLYHWNLSRFFASRLWVKIYWWLPIFGVFIALLYGGWPVACLVVAGLLIQTVREWWRQWQQAGKPRLLATGYLLLFSAALIQLVSLSLQSQHAHIITLISICFASVLSDVLAFFAGSYMGQHKLPSWINPHKSYEGVMGQIVGAVIGLALVALTPEINFSWLLALGVGVASAFGDLLNSVTKRQLAIKDWGQTIPGHGGILDRFSSLSFALAIGYVLVALKLI